MPVSKAAVATRKQTVSALIPAPRRNTKRQQLVSFEVDTQNDNGGEAEDDEYIEDTGDEELGGDGVVDMLNILQEYQKKKSSKSSSRAATLEGNIRKVKDDAYTQIKEIKAAGAAYIENINAQIDALEEQEIPPDRAFADIATLFERRSKNVESHLETLNHLLTILSPARVEIIEQNSANLHSHTARFGATRKRAMKQARRDLHSGIEQQKLATDAQAYIKHYKYLVQ